MALSVSLRTGVRILLMACAVAGSGQPALSAATDVIVGLPAGIRVSFAYLTAGMELGYFEDEGINPVLQSFQGGAVVMTQVANKGVEIGLASADPLIVASGNGTKSLPIRFFYNQTREYIWEWAVAPESSIKSFGDLRGKTIGVGSLANSHISVTRLILKEAGLNDTDYELIAVGDGGPAFKALLDGKIDAYNTARTNIASYEAVGGAVRRLDVSDRFKGIFQTGFFAHEDTLKENPELFSGFGRALTKGTIVCKNAPEWCIRTFWKYYPEHKPSGDVDAKEMNGIAKSVVSGWEPMFSFPQGSAGRFGEYPDGSWENVFNILVEGGAIPATLPDADSFYTNELVDGFNDFDETALLRKAASLKSE